MKRERKKNNELFIIFFFVHFIWLLLVLLLVFFHFRFYVHISCMHWAHPPHMHSWAFKVQKIVRNNWLAGALLIRVGDESAHGIHLFGSVHCDYNRFDIRSLCATFVQSVTVCIHPECIAYRIGSKCNWPTEWKTVNGIALHKK